MWDEPKQKYPLSDEPPKHRKKSQKKPSKKADHKHNYQLCIGHCFYRSHDFHTGQQRAEHRYVFRTKCSICGKLRYLSYAEGRRLYSERIDEPHNHLFISSPNLPALFPELEIVEVQYPW